MYLYNVNEEAYHLILSSKKIDSEFLIACNKLPIFINNCKYAYFIDDIVVQDDRIKDFLQEITKICLNNLKLVWVDVKEYEKEYKIKEMKKINVLSDDINIIKYALEYDIYEYSRMLEFVYE